MDKFLIKKPRVETKAEPSSSGASAPVMKQSTIDSLQRVVVVEDIERLKSKLILPNQSASTLIKSLKELGKKVPPRHVLLSTKIGHQVNKLRKHECEDVAKEARRVYAKWRTFFEEKKERPQIEVKCDKKAEDMRLRGKKLLSEALKVEEEDNLVDAIERECFYQHKRLISPGYRRSMRNIIFKLRNTEGLRTSVLDGELSVEKFVRQFKKR